MIMKCQFLKLFLEAQGAHAEEHLVALHAGDGLDFHLGALRQGLLYQLVGQLAATDGLKAGVILHLGREGDLTAESALFDEQDALFGTAGIDGGGETRRACTDDDNVVHTENLVSAKQGGWRTTHLVVDYYLDWM